MTKKRCVNGVELALVDRGQGPVTLLVHGFPLDGTMWSGQIDCLAEQGRVIVPDMRGFGQSGPAGDITTMEQMADDLAALLDALEIDEPIALGGLSMGGYVALAFAAKYVSRLAALVLCDTRAGADAPEAARGRHETARRVLAEGLGAVADSMMPRLLAPATERDRPDVADAVRRMILRADPRAVAAALRGMAQRADSTPLLGAIRCPVLAIVGAQDAITPPAEMRAMADAFPRARLVEIPGAGHLATMEQPAMVNEVLTAFLAGARG